MAKRFVVKATNRDRRRARVRARVIGTAKRPRLAVFRSAKHIVAQLIDDAAGRTIAVASDRDVLPSVPSSEVGAEERSRKVALAHAVGGVIAQRARECKVTAVVFDRGGYAYHGRVRAVAEGARAGGLEF